MSLQRQGNEDYRDYLASGAWAWRRQRWFRTCRARGFEPACQVCLVMLKDTGTLDLHHVSYDGVQQEESGKWRSSETDRDLMPMCRDCHQELHHRMDRPGDYQDWDRRRATVVVIGHLRRTFEKGRASWLQQSG